MTSQPNTPRKVVALCGSPRRNGNARRLAEALCEGAGKAGHETELIHIPDWVDGMLRDCKECRKPDGHCAIDDRFEELFFEKMLPADAWVYAVPLYWYGVSGIFKNILDRSFCCMPAGHPECERVIRDFQHKKCAVLMSAEENNLPARLGVLAHMEELCRYLRHDFVGFVVGVGNARADTLEDPANPVGEAHALGRRLFEVRETNYTIDSERPKKVWSEETFFPVTWR